MQKHLAVPGNVREELFFDWSFPVLFREHVSFSFLSVRFHFFPHDTLPRLLNDAAATTISCVTFNVFQFGVTYFFFFLLIPSSLYIFETFFRCICENLSRPPNVFYYLSCWIS